MTVCFCHTSRSCASSRTKASFSLIIQDTSETGQFWPATAFIISYLCLDLDKGEIRLRKANTSVSPTEHVTLKKKMLNEKHEPFSVKMSMSMM